MAAASAYAALARRLAGYVWTGSSFLSLCWWLWMRRILVRAGGVLWRCCVVVLWLWWAVWLAGAAPSSRPAPRAAGPPSRPATRAARASSRPVAARLGHQKAKGCIKGRVLDRRGRPLARVLVRTWPRSSPKLTGPDGRFVLCYRRVVQGTARVWRRPLAPGAYRLSLYKFGYQHLRRRFLFRRRDTMLPDAALQPLSRPLCVAQKPRVVWGLFEGLERRCWPHGTWMVERRWQQGRRHGAALFVTASGHRYEQMAYRRGRRHGAYLRWHANGRKACAARFRGGALVGPWRCWGPQGRRLAATPWKARPARRRLPRQLQDCPLATQRTLLAWVARDPSPGKLRSRPWIAWLRASGPDQHLRRPFTVPATSKAGLSVRIVAFGEARHQQITDKAWIERRDTGQIVWQMRHRRTRAAGPDPRHRFVDRLHQLRPGAYVLHYATDATHDPAHWITPPPPESGRYGVTLYVPGSQGYRLLMRP